MIFHTYLRAKTAAAAAINDGALKKNFFLANNLAQRRRINTEDKAKVVVAVWGTELIQFLSVIATLYYCSTI